MERQTVLNVVGMTCGGCARHVERALRSVPGVADVIVSLRDARAVVKHDGVPTAELSSALEAAGYGGTPASADDERV